MTPTDAPAPPATDSRGFSSRWMLDGRDRDAAAPVAGDANASARAIDTDGDGVADTLSLRVDAPRPTIANRLGTWLARSIVTVLVVASLVLAGAALAGLYQARQELDRTTAMLAEERAALADARADADRSADRIAALERDAGNASTTAARIEAERDELELEVQVLRGMLLDEDRRATTTR